VKTNTNLHNLKNSFLAGNVISNKNSSLFKSEYSEFNKDDVTTLNINPNKIFEKENFEFKITRSKNSSRKSLRSIINKGNLNANSNTNVNVNVNPNANQTVYSKSNNNVFNSKIIEKAALNLNTIKNCKNISKEKEKDNKEEIEKKIISHFNSNKQKLSLLNDRVVIFHVTKKILFLNMKKKIFFCLIFFCLNFFCLNFFC
jgi:hypothetical protein